MTKKATEDELSELHSEFARVLKKFLTAEYKDEDGNKIPPPSHVLANARQFLKDNHIEVGTSKAGELAGLADLPVFDEDPDAARH